MLGYMSCLCEDWLKAVLGDVQGDFKTGWSLNREIIEQVNLDFPCPHVASYLAFPTYRFIACSMKNQGILHVNNDALHNVLENSGQTTRRLKHSSIASRPGEML